MSEDNVNKDLIGLTLSDPLLAKITERANLAGVSRQDVIKGILVNSFFLLD